MYCTKCGKEVPGGTNICAYCGAENEAIENKPSASKGLVGLIAGIIAAVVIGILVVNSFNVNSSPEKISKTYIEAMYEADAADYVKCFADYWLEDITGQLGLSKDASRKEIANALAGRWSLEQKYPVTIKSCKEISRYDKSEYRIYYREEGMTEADYAAITEIAVVEISYIAEGLREDSDKLTCIKMDGKWYVMD